LKTALALNIPHSGPSRSRYQIAWIDVVSGMGAFDIWGRIGWRDINRRYRRTIFGPFWTTVSLSLFVITLGLVWTNLWNKDPRSYLPYLTAGMVCWSFFLTTCTEGCSTFLGFEKIVRQLRISYTLLACAVVWRNAGLFLHNLVTFILVGIYGGVSITWATLLVIPGFALFFLNAVWIITVLGTACTRYRDLLQLVANLLQIALFLTPIFWSPDQLTGYMSVLVEFNPVYHLITVVRDPLLGKAPELFHWLIVLSITIIGWMITLQMLAKVRHRIVYWL
jgi:ABC-type polysaccharide/polyol phosphate export permease